jgi:hypothetical protein
MISKKTDRRPTGVKLVAVWAYTCSPLEGSWLALDPYGGGTTSISLFGFYQFLGAFYPANNDNTIETNRAGPDLKSILFHAIFPVTVGS